MDTSIKREREDSATRIAQIELAHRQDIEALKAKAFLLEEASNDVNKTLQERSSLLGDMVEHNKFLEAKLDDKEGRIADLQESLREGQIELASKQDELNKLRRDLREKEDTLEEVLDLDRTQRAVSEAELKALRSKLSLVGRKNAHDLQKENGVLKDRLRRQGGYMKKKPSQDRAPRDQVSSRPSRIPSRKDGSRRYQSELSVCSELSSVQRSMVSADSDDATPIPEWEIMRE